MNDSTRQTAGSRLLEVLLIFLVFFAAAGEPPPEVNESHYLPKAKHYWNPEFCPGDYFLDSADAHAVFYWSVGWLTRFAPLPAVAWIGRIAAWLWLAWSWQRLATAVGTPKYTSVVAAMLLVAAIEHYNFAGEWVVGGVEAKCFAYGFVFLGLSYLAVDRYLPVGVAFGAAAAFHVLVGGWSVVAAAIVWVAKPSLWRRTWRPAVAGLLLGGLLSLPGLLPALALNSEATPETESKVSQIYVFERLPHHLAPLSLDPEELGERFFRFGVLAVAVVAVWTFHQKPMRAARPSTGEPAGEPMLRVLQFAGASIIVSGVGILLEVALIDHPATAARLLRYYWFRLADVAVPAAGALGLCTALNFLGPIRAGALLALAVIAGGTHLGVETTTRFNRPVPPGVKRMNNVAAWLDACQWIRENTPNDSVFLIPWHAQSFKWYAHRADAGNRKDIPQDAEGVLEWARRLEARRAASPMAPGRRRDKLRQKSEEKLLELGEQWGATHVIVDSHQLSLPMLYENDEYAIYRLEEEMRD